MKTRVIVTPKEGVLDPQGETIRRALNKQGYPVLAVRQGKYFELEFNSPPDKAMLEEISGGVLSNPIVENFFIEESGEPDAARTVPGKSGKRKK